MPSAIVSASIVVDECPPARHPLRPSSAVYLTGATLFLSLLLARVFSIVLDLITVQDELNVLKTKVSLLFPWQSREKR